MQHFQTGMAASAAAVEIRDIFNEIISNNLRYCALCLRTEKERKLVEPTEFTKCLCIMRLRAPAVGAVCYVCEAASRRAVALFQSVRFSCVIDSWFREMSTKRRYINEMPAHLDKYMESNIRANTSLPGPAPLPLATAWSRARALHDLARTDLLVVSDAPPGGQQPEGRKVVEKPLPPRPDPIPLPPPPPQNRTIIPPVNPVIDSIVIIVDDDDPPDAEEPPGAPAPIGGAAGAGAPGVGAPSVGAPGVGAPGAGAAGVVPGGGVVEITEHSGPVAVLPGEMQGICSDKDQTGFILHPIVTGADGALRVPSLRARLEGGRLVSEPALPGSTGGRDRRSPLPYSGSPTDMEVSQEDDKDDEALSHGELIPAAVAADNTFGVPDPHARAAATPLPAPSPPRAARPAGRIDWEDKIPMDVISFVDATDPLAKTILKSPAEVDPPPLVPYPPSKKTVPHPPPKKVVPQPPPKKVVAHPPPKKINAQIPSKVVPRPRQIPTPPSYRSPEDVGDLLQPTKRRRPGRPPKLKQISNSCDVIDLC